MADSMAATETPAAFDTCPQCGYSLRGLPARHTCPECGLHYDEHSAIFRAVNPKVIFVVFAGMFMGGVPVLQNMSHLTNLGAATWWQRVAAIAGLVWLPMIAALMYVLYRRYKRGYFVAVSADGLIVQLPGWDDKLVPWADVERVSHRETKPGKPHEVRLTFATGRKHVNLGGVCNVFPRPEQAERFVASVNAYLHPKK